MATLIGFLSIVSAFGLLWLDILEPERLPHDFNVNIWFFGLLVLGGLAATCNWAATLPQKKGGEADDSESG